MIILLIENKSSQQTAAYVAHEQSSNVTPNFNSLLAKHVIISPNIRTCLFILCTRLDATDSMCQQLKQNKLLFTVSTRFQRRSLLFFHRRKGLAFVDLNVPNVITKKVTRNSKWECGAIEWNPHLSHANIFANAVSFLA